MRAPVTALAFVSVFAVTVSLSACGEAATTQQVAQAVDGAAAPAVGAEPDIQLDVPYVPTREPVVERMLEMAQVGPDDYVIDLGSGDGRIPIAAARRGARGFGVDINPVRIREANANAEQAGVTDRVDFRQQDLFKTPISDATVLTMYLLPSVNMQLRPRLLSELRPGTRVVSHAFDMEDWRPDEEDEVDGSQVYMWIIPAQVAGRWRITGGEAGDMTVDLRQNFQELEGTARVGGREVPIREGRVRGENLSFVVDTAAGPRLVSAQLQNNALTPAPAPDGAPQRALSGWKASKVS